MAMVTRIVNTALLLTALVGFCMTLIIFAERSQLVEEYERYVDKVGRLKIDEPKKIHVKQITTDASDHFAWRVYLPPSPNAGFRNQIFLGDDKGAGTNSNRTNDEGYEATIRVALRHNGDAVEASINGLKSPIKNGKVADFVHQHWDELQFEVAADTKTLIQVDDKAIKLLVVRLPKQLADSFVVEHGEEFRAAVERPFSFYHGLKSAKDWP